MKKLALAFSLLALSAHAADNYDCAFVVSKDGAPVGEISIQQQYGTKVGRLFTLPVSKKKNIFGKVVEVVEVTLDGTLENGGQTDAMNNNETGIDAKFSLVTSVDRKSPISHNTSTTKLSITSIHGRGAVDVSPSFGQYTVTGGCTPRSGE